MNEQKKGETYQKIEMYEIIIMKIDKPARDTVKYWTRKTVCHCMEHQITVFK